MKKKTTKIAPKIDDQKKSGRLVSEKEERIKRHKEQAHALNGRISGIVRFKSYDNHLEMILPAGTKTIPYYVSDEEWDRQVSSRT